ncbi:MAG: hypothetical protein K2Y29_11785 [Beijerinckiaceae bacterium]|nr:hypothetical protein [Beijerinckiaceae bacterium]
MKKSDFTPEQKALHAFWFQMMTDKGNEQGNGDAGRQHRELAAETMFSVAMMAWASFHESPVETARKLYILSLNFAEIGGIGDPHETVDLRDHSGTTH